MSRQINEHDQAYILIDTDAQITTLPYNPINDSGDHSEVFRKIKEGALLALHNQAKPVNNEIIEFKMIDCANVEADHTAVVVTQIDDTGEVRSHEVEQPELKTITFTVATVTLKDEAVEQPVKQDYLTVYVKESSKINDNHWAQKARVIFINDGYVTVEHLGRKLFKQSSGYSVCGQWKITNGLDELPFKYQLVDDSEFVLEQREIYENHFES